MENLTIKFIKLSDKAVIPSYAHNGDVCMDLTATDLVYNEKLDMYEYHTGLAFESPFNYGQFLFVRSSNRKTDAYLCNHVGIADSAIYRGEIILCFKNRDSFKTMVTNRIMELLVTNSDDINFNALYNQAYKEIKEKTLNLEFAPYQVGDRVAQMVFINYPTVILEEATQLSETERGSGAFGSTGK